MPNWVTLYLRKLFVTLWCYQLNHATYLCTSWSFRFWISSAQQGPILCGRPILKSTIPSLCNIHFPKAQKDVKHALKKAGLNVSSSSKLAPKFHVVIAEYVHQIQSKRRAAQKHKYKTVVVKEELPTWPAFSIGNTLLGYSCAAE